MNEQPMAEAPREYGELYYHSSAVIAILDVVAGLLEGDQRSAVLRLSHDIPTTMRWDDRSADLEQQADQRAVCISVLLRLQHNALLGSTAVRLIGLLRRGPTPEFKSNRKHGARLADEQSNPSE